MNTETDHPEALKKRIRALEEENKLLREGIRQQSAKGDTVSVPGAVKPLFDAAQKVVGEYFKDLQLDPTKGSIMIHDQRYVLVRASALSYDFLNTIKSLYIERGEQEAYLIGRNFLFDIAHVIGLEDARNFHQRMNLTDPIAKLSAGPVHFAYTGWAFVDILPESNPSPDDNYYLKYHHPYSFEAASWIKSGERSEFPVCIMNAGYSSGWCEASFGIPLTAVEISCRAKGDEHCTFIMAPPHRIHDYLEQEVATDEQNAVYDIPMFFERKKAEEQILSSLKEKEVLLKEIHHRVKNNLQIISSLLRLQSNSIKDEDSRIKLEESINRVKSMAMIHEKLYSSVSLSNVNFNDYLKSLLQSMKDSYPLVAQNVSLSINCEQESEYFPIDFAVPCGLIVNELVSNAFKYAFDDDSPGTIDVCFKALLDEEQSHYTLRVQDNGKGMGKDIDIYHTDSFGLQLITTLVEQLEGNIELERNQGTSFTITFSSTLTAKP